MTSAWGKSWAFSWGRAFGAVAEELASGGDWKQVLAVRRMVAQARKQREIEAEQAKQIIAAALEVGVEPVAQKPESPAYDPADAIRSISDQLDRIVKQRAERNAAITAANLRIEKQRAIDQNNAALILLLT